VSPQERPVPPEQHHHETNASRTTPRPSTSSVTS
jgi:hypothetical protein